VGSCLELDVKDLSGRGCLQPGWSGTCQWIWGGAVFSVALHAEAERLCLSWRGELGDRAESIPIVHVPCTLGGSRPYFRCPGEGAAGCGRHKSKLYFSRGRFLCRHCCGLVYALAYESPRERPLRRAQRRAAELWQQLNRADTVTAPEFERLLEETLQAEVQVAEAQTTWLQQFVARIENRSPKPAPSS
jgi:hypothetical protein